MSAPSCRELRVHNYIKGVKLEDYEYELLNMSYEEMDRIANGEGDHESEDPDIRSRSDTQSRVDVRIVSDEHIEG